MKVKIIAESRIRDHDGVVHGFIRCNHPGLTFLFWYYYQNGEAFLNPSKASYCYCPKHGFNKVLMNTPWREFAIKESMQHITKLGTPQKGAS